MSAEITVSKEDYLKAIIEAESEGHIVIPALLAQWLHVSPPAVTNAVKRLRQDGYIDAPRGDALKLTAKGRDAAHRTALRHHLVERMLTEMFGMEWHQVHAEAERLEHAISPVFEAKLIEKLGETGDCPHGNGVLPLTPAQMKKRGLHALSEAAEGKDYLVVSLYERDSRLLEFLHQIGIGPRVPVRVLQRNYDETVLVLTPNGPVTVGKSAASRVWVRPTAPDEPKRSKIK
ncbi:MAG TPA: metal-dependent transcriptional regulator [Silvibacterium sp.]|jgi:DtxR family Mn-dependent transcriptional regulator|nr:metal-dependent transcriptional regulator [Silvibacterium sp.]